MGLSVVTTFVLPRAWVQVVRGLFQPLALLQMPTWWAARGTGDALEGLAESKISQE